MIGCFRLHHWHFSYRPRDRPLTDRMVRDRRIMSFAPAFALALVSMRIDLARTLKDAQRTLTSANNCSGQLHTHTHMPHWIPLTHLPHSSDPHHHYTAPPSTGKIKRRSPNSKLRFRITKAAATRMRPTRSDKRSMTSGLRPRRLRSPSRL